MARDVERGAGAPAPAQRVTTPIVAEPHPWYFAVRLAEGRYAFSAPLVTEVVRLGPLTRLPCAPTFLLGVFTHRGEVLPVLDLGDLLLRRPVARSPAARAAIVQAEPWHVAIVADEIEGLIRVEQRRLGPPPAPAANEFVQAVAADDLGDISVLDLATLVTAARSRSVPT